MGLFARELGFSVIVTGIAWLVGIAGAIGIDDFSLSSGFVAAGWWVGGGRERIKSGKLAASHRRFFKNKRNSWREKTRPRPSNHPQTKNHPRNGDATFHVGGERGAGEKRVGLVPHGGEKISNPSLTAWANTSSD